MGMEIMGMEIMEFRIWSRFNDSAPTRINMKMFGGWFR